MPHFRCQVVSSLVIRLCQLLKRGVGLNTRVGTAKYCGQLLLRMPGALKPHATQLASALMTMGRGEASAAGRRQAASSLAAVAKLCSKTRVSALVGEVAQLYL